MTDPSLKRSAFPIQRLELWAEGLHRNQIAADRCLAQLAAEGVRPAESPPRLRPGDGERVVRLKEELVALHRERSAIRDQLARAGIELIPGPPLELLLGDGPEPGSRLSWQPGEPAISHWRAAGEGLGDARRPLAAGATPLTEPLRH